MVSSLLRSAALAAACVVSAAGLAPAGADEKPKVKVEFRRAETKPADGLTEAVVPDTKQKVYLHKTAEVTDADIAEARVTEDARKKPALELVFTREGGKKVAKLTAEHLEKPVAILVDGKVITAPVVKAKISDRTLVTGEFTKEELERIAKALNAK